jgi:DNA polymerase-2
MEPVTGLHHNVLVFDFKSLYPSLIRTFEIDPLGFLPPDETPDATHRDAIVAPNGAAFRRQPGVLPGLLDQLFPRRDAAKMRGDAVASQAIKILMNSFYGVLGTPACRFYNPRVAGAITSFGRELLLWTQARCEALGHRVLYGDTDSLFVEANEEEPAAALAVGAELAARLNADLAAHIERTWGVESRLELQLERLYLRLVLLALRGTGHGGGKGGKSGAAKRYVGLVAPEGERPARVVFTGMESVRRDWTALAKQVQRELYERLFADRPVEEYLRSTVAELRAGGLDELLVYRKALRRDPDSYTSTTPPHVAAARRLAEAGQPRRRGLVSYWMTKAGAEPVELPPQAEIDYQHYVDKQLQPIAEPVLSLLGLDFKQVIGDDRQLALF